MWTVSANVKVDICRNRVSKCARQIEKELEE